jgi:DNA-binding SARP family transcriptional activator
VGWIGRLPTEVLADAPELALLQVRAEIWLMHLEEAHALLDRLDAVLTEPRDQARALLYRGIAWRQARRLDDALLIQRRARAMLEEVEPEHSELRIEADIEEGTVLGMRGELGPAVQLLSRAATAADRAGQMRLGGHARLNLGLALQFGGRLAEASEAFREARRVWEYLGESELTLLTMNNAATSAHMRGDLEGAEASYTSIAALAEHRGRFGALAALGLADLARDRGEPARAEPLYLEALELARSIEHRGVEAAAHFGRAMLALDRGEIDRARADLDHQLRVAELQASGEFASRFELGLASVLLAEGRNREALEALDAILGGPARGYQRRQAVLLLRATAQFRLGERAAAEATLLELHELVLGLGYDQFVVAEAHRCLDLLGDPSVAGLAGGYFARLPERSRPAAGASVAAPAAGSAAFDLCVHAFGIPTVTRPGEPGTDLPWRSERSKELLLFLLTRQGSAGRADVEAALWPETPVAQLSSLFHNNLHRLRRTIGEEAVLRDRDGYRVNPALRIDFDVARFEAHLAAADAAEAEGDVEGRAEELRRALAEHVGPFARTFDSAWAEELRARLEDRFVAAALTLARLDIAAGRYREAITTAESVLELDGLNEEAVRHLIAAHVGAGFPDLALRAYRRLQDLSERELGVPPSLETRRALDRSLGGLRSTG